MQDVGFFAMLEKLIGDEPAIEREKERLDSLIGKISTTIKGAITVRSAPGLVWDLAIKELQRIRPLVSIRVSDFAGQARFLRALLAAVPFATVEASDNPETEQLLDECKKLWEALFFREMMDDFKLTARSEVEKMRRRIGSLMSLLGAVELEGIFIDQAESRIRALYGPFSKEIIEPQIGLSIEEIVGGFDFIRNELARRFNHAEGLLQPLVLEWQRFQKLSPVGAKRYMKQLTRPNARREPLTDSFKEGMDLYKHFLTFSPENFPSNLAGKALPFLEAFSFIPGTVNLDLNTPFDDDAVRSRPFARINGNQFLIVDPIYASLAPLYRLDVCFDDPNRRRRLFKQRDRTLEDDGTRILAPVVSPALQLRNYYLPIGTTGELAERDLLFFRDGILILVEAKAKPLRSIAGHRGDLRKIESDVKDSIQVGYNQASSVWRHIAESENVVVFYDSDKARRKEIARLHRSQVRKVFTVVLVDSSFGHIGTDLSPWLLKDESVGFPWVVNRDTLELITLKIDTFEKLTSFLDWRREIHGNVFEADEAVVAGFFVTHGPTKFGRENKLQLLGPDYTDVFESEYFSRKGIPVDPPTEGSGKPVLVSFRREGTRIIQKVDGKVHDSFEIGSANPSAGGIQAVNRQRKSPNLRPSTFPVTLKKSRQGLIGRNDPCPCKSGLKFKKCCLEKSR